VLLYELFSLGEVPYLDLPKSELLTFLRGEQRLEKPDLAPEEMFGVFECALMFHFSYDFMLHCWNIDPLQRPTFEQIGDFMRQILRDKNGKDYYSPEYNSCQADESCIKVE
jgi:tyrosine-protein kinase receptor torso